MKQSPSCCTQLELGDEIHSLEARNVSASSLNELLFVTATTRCTAACPNHEEKQVQNVARLLHLRTDPNASQGAALQHAQTANIVHLLVDGKANVDIADECGRTAVMRAAQRYNTSVALALVHHGADLNRSDRFGQTAVSLSTIPRHVFEQHGMQPLFVHRL